MRYLTVGEVLEIYSQMMRQFGGGVGIRDIGALESAVARSRCTGTDMTKAKRPLKVFLYHAHIIPLWDVDTTSWHKPGPCPRTVHPPAQRTFSRTRG